MDKVREFHSLGRQALQAAPLEREKKHHAGVIKQFARPGVSVPTVYKARQFAATYSDEELDQLCARRSPAGKPLGIGHVYELILIRKAKLRLQFEERAALEGWSARRLRTERLLACGASAKASKAGRKPKLPERMPEFLQQLSQRTEQWLRWSVAILANSAAQNSTDSPAQPSRIRRRSRRSKPVRVPLKIQRALEDINVAFKRLKAALPPNEQPPHPLGTTS
jgi:hypothetical protein